MKNYHILVEVIATYSWDIEAKNKAEAIKEAEEKTDEEIENHGVQEYSLEGIERKI